MCVSRHVSRLPRPRRTGGVFLYMLLPVQIRTPSSTGAGQLARGQALWEREAAGSGTRVRWGRPLLSRPRGAFGSWAAAVEPLSRPRIRSVTSRLARSGRAGVLVGLDGCEVRLCDPCACVRPCVPCVSRLPPVPRCLFTGTGPVQVPACARVSRVSRVCPGSPRCLFTGTDSSTRSRLEGEQGSKEPYPQAVGTTACS